MRKSNGKIKPNESDGIDAEKMCSSNLNEGNPSNSSIYEPETNMMLTEERYKYILPDWRCLACRRTSNIDFEENLKKFDMLPLVDKLAAQIEYRHELDISFSIHHQDYIGVLDKEIAFNKVKLDDLMKNQEAKKKIDYAANRVIHPEAFKLELDVDEGELAELMREFILTARNKRGNQVYRDSNVKYGRWICDSIVLTSKQELNYLTILKGLSKTAHPKKEKGVDMN